MFNPHYNYTIFKVIPNTEVSFASEGIDFTETNFDW